MGVEGASIKSLEHFFKPSPNEINAPKEPDIKYIICPM